MDRIAALKELHAKSLARQQLAIDNFLGNDTSYKILELKTAEEAEGTVFEVPMIPFKWVESFEGFFTMLVNDGSSRSICMCKSKGSVRLPQYSHPRNERFIVIDGKVVDHVTEKVYNPDDVFDYPSDSTRDLEFIDCIVTLILTPCLEFKGIKI